jgi:hypothetical protein
MANTSPSANMSLPIPVPGVQSGPQYAININDCLTIVDQHTHTPGSGVPITSAALDINADLTINAHNLTSIKSLRLSPQSTTLVGASDLGCIYEVNDDLYFNDGNGTAIRITQNGAVAGTPGSIANLTSPASASYVAASSSFVFQSDVNTPANLDAASILIRNLSASSFALQLDAPAAMGANYGLTLPPLPGAKKIMTLDSAGAMQGDYDVDGTSIEIASNTIRVKDGGLSTAKYADASITAAKLAAGVLKPLSTDIFTSSGNWVCPAGVTSVILFGAGGGGGGGGGYGPINNAGGGGGGGGAKGATIPVTVVPGTTYAVTIGGGGAGGGGGAPGAAGGGGGTTSFGSLASFIGGDAGGAGSSVAGGAGGTGDNPGGAGGSSGAGAGGSTCRAPAVFGGAGSAAASSSSGGGGGGAGALPGSTGGAGGVGLAGVGSVGNGYGSGGGGGHGANTITGGAGGTGAPGILMISYVAVA